MNVVGQWARHAVLASLCYRPYLRVLPFKFCLLEDDLFFQKTAYLKSHHIGYYVAKNNNALSSPVSLLAPSESAGFCDGALKVKNK